MIKRYILLLLSIGLLQDIAFAQPDLPITNSSDTICAGFFTDDGGDAGIYSNLNYVYTLCPESGDQVISVDFNEFALQVSVNPNNSDYLNIYDGPTVASPSLGSYTGTQLAGLNATGTVFNDSGCLTFEFDNNSGNTGEFPGWLSSVTCTTPCNPPTQNSSITSPLPPVSGFDSVSVCVGEEVTFSSAGSSAAPGFFVDNYVWKFDDGSIEQTAATSINHSFNQPGEYIVTVAAEDNNGCQSINILPLKVVVATLPDLTFIYPAETCVGETIEISGQAEGVLWTAAPPILVAGQTFLDDDVGNLFSSELIVDIFDPALTIESVQDIENICIVMEHSYLGDLVIQLTCPDGTTINLQDQGGGSCNLGIPWATNPVDGFSNNFTPGVGFEYCWSWEGTQSLEQGCEGPFDFVSGDGPGTYSDTQSPAGLYSADGGLDNFIGCPLNGTWTLGITDFLGADNGYVFSWGINFDPNLYPGITTFEPIYGQGADSTYWTGGPEISYTSGNADTIHVEAFEPGVMEFTYTSINDFGCSFDSTISITVLEPYEIDAGPDQEHECSVPFNLDVEVLGGPPPAPSCDYSLVLTDTWGDGWGGGEVEISVGGTPETFTLATGATQTFTFSVDHNASLEVSYAAGVAPDENQYEIFNANGDLVFQDGQFGAIPGSGTVFQGTATCFADLPNIVYEWSPPDNLNNANAQSPIVTGLTQSTAFTVTAWRADHPDCVFTDEVFVEITGGLYAGDDLGDCTMSYQLSATNNPNTVWSAPTGSGVTFSNIYSHNTTVTGSVSGVFELTLTDTTGQTCPIADVLQVSFFDAISIEPTITEPLCYGDCTGEVSITATGGNPGALGYTYEFSSGSNGLSPEQARDLCAGTHTVNIIDADGCSTVNAFTMTQPPAPYIDSVITARETCMDFCDGRISIYSPVATGYSFDGGDTFSADNENLSACGGYYEVAILDANGCDVKEDAFVTSPIPPNANFSADPFKATVLDPVIQFMNFSEYHVENLWSFGDENNFGTSTEENPSILFPGNPDIYSVQLTVTDSIGCQDSLRLDIEIIDDLQVFIPSAFTPNGDGKNDSFEPIMQDVDPNDFVFEIYDRAGNRVFETRQLPVRWNGQGHLNESYYVENGVYVWRLKAGALSTTAKYEKMGTITVIR